MVAMMQTGGLAKARRVPFIDMKVHAFFDSPRVKRAMDTATRQALSESGKELRSISRRSMKWKPLGVYAPPGMPPHAHRKRSRKGASVGMRKRLRAQSGGLRKAIMYAYDSINKSVVVGPSNIRGANIVRIGETHEFGGRVSRRNPRRTKRQLGDGGEIRIGGRRVETTKKTKDTLLGDVWVTYSLLTTPAMAARADRFNEELYGPETIRGSYPPRPFMRPGLRQIQPRLPNFWRNTVR